mgnify:CR=1 FL=1
MTKSTAKTPLKLKRLLLYLMKHTNYLKNLIFIAIPILHFGCNYIPCSSSSDLNKVKNLYDPSLIAGIYKPDEFTKQDFKEYSNSDTTFLEIHKNGNISLHNFPVSTFDSWEKPNRSTVNGSGTWTSSFKSNTTIITANITFDQKRIMPFSPFRLFKKNDKYYILIDFGDPDNCTSVRLRQQ